MRWGYLLPRVLIVAAVWAFFTFGFDPLLRYGLVSAGQSAVGARVDVDRLDTTFFPPSLELGRVQVADASAPMTNLTEFENLRVSLAGKPLLHRRFVVEEGTLSGLQWGTPRETSGALPESERNDHDNPAGSIAGQFAQAVREQAGELGKQWLDDLLDRARAEVDPNQLESLHLAQDLEAEWKTRIASLKQRVEQIKTRVEQLEEGVQNAEGDTLQRIRAYEQAAREARDLLREAESIRGELDGLARHAQNDLQRIDVAKQKDLQTIRSKLELLEMDGREITNWLLGPRVTTLLTQTGEWIEYVKRYGGALSSKPSPERFRGIDVEFPRSDSGPAFVLEKLGLSGVASLGKERIPFRGVVTGLSSDPALYGKPVVVRALGDGRARIQLEAILDHRSETPRHDVKLACALPERTEMKLGEGDDLSVLVAAERTDWKARLQLDGERLSGRISMVQSPVTIDATAGEDVQAEIARVVSNALAGVKDVRADVVMSGTLQRPEWTLESNVGPQVADGLQVALEQELAAQKQRLMAEADRLISEKTAELQAKLNGQFQQVVAKLDLEEQDARSLVQKLAGGKLPGNLPVDPGRLGIDPSRLPVDPGKLELPLGNGGSGNRRPAGAALDRLRRGLDPGRLGLGGNRVRNVDFERPARETEPPQPNERPAPRDLRDRLEGFAPFRR